jgi:hypothetical protein
LTEPPDADWFGHIHNPAAPHVQGGCSFLRVAAARRMLAQTGDGLRFSRQESWLPDGLEPEVKEWARATGWVSFDFIIATLRRELGLTMADWPEIHSVCGSTPLPPELTSFSVVHPAKVQNDGDKRVKNLVASRPPQADRVNPGSQPSSVHPAPPLKVAVVTPYFREREEWLRQCHESVKQQTHPATHILVGDGERQVVCDTFEALHMVLPQNANDWGDTPRAAGATMAWELGFEAVAFLDGDNWYYRDHLEKMIALHRATGASLLTCRRIYHHLDGWPMAECLTSDGVNFCDTNCWMFMRPAREVSLGWSAIEPEFHAIDDRVLHWIAMKSGLPHAHLPRPTVAYRVKRARIYRDLSVPVPEGAQRNPTVTIAAQKWAELGRTPAKIRWLYRPIPRTQPALR